MRNAWINVQGEKDACPNSGRPRFVCEGSKSTLLIHYSEINISTASSGESAQKTLKSENIDIAILDLFMPGAGGGFNFIESVCDSFPQLPVVVLSASESHAHIGKCLDLGVLGFVTKSSPKGALFEAIDRALLGKVSAPERLTQSIPAPISSQLKIL